VTAQAGLSWREENSEDAIEYGEEENIGNSEEGSEKRKEQMAL